jgi:hypothetical protein
MIDTLKLIGFILVSPVVAFLLIFLLGGAAPIVLLMFFGMYFVIGPLLQLLVRLIPQAEKVNQPTPWAQYLALSLTAVLRAGAVLAIFRLLFHLFARRIVHEQDHFILRDEVDYVLAGCGLLYALVSFVQEGLWQYRQVLAVRNLATSPVASAAIGLVELSGIVRRQENRDGPIDQGHVVMHFFWQLLGTHRMGKTIMLGSYDKVLKPFYLDDGTGAILVDPAHDDVELRRPLASALTTFFGRRSFEIVLTRNVQRPSWDQRRYFLHEGDRVHVIGSAEMNETVPHAAVDTDRLIVRPRKEARSGFESLLQFLIPSRRVPTRTVHDIFIIADTTEAETRQLLMRNFLASAGMAVALAILSALLVIVRVSGN